jgi:hypothetical protein
LRPALRTVPEVSKGRGIAIRNPAPGGSAFTNRNRALRFIRDGRARFINERCIEMIAVPAPIAESSAPRSSPRLGKVVPFRADAFQGQTFLRYPQEDAFLRIAA